MTILSALALINRAYFLVWQSLASLPHGSRKAANNLLDACLGLNGILNGQALDLRFAVRDGTAMEIERIALLKTGALLRLSLLLPAISGGVEARCRRSLRRLADSWGCVYQLLDDFKDVEWGANASGKTPLRDATLGRPNLAIALGRERASARLRGLLEEGRRIVSGLSGSVELASALEPFQVQLEASGETFLAVCAA